jgi:hypothetical protein
MKVLHFFIFILACYTLKSQDLNIYYDVHSDSMWFMKDNKVVTEPTVKKGKQVYFHLVEFNNYIYKAKFKATNSTAPFSAAAPNNSLVKGLLSGFANTFLPGAALPLLSSPLFGNILGVIPENQQGGRGGQDDVMAFEAKLKELEAAKAEINALSEEINARRKSLTALNNTYEFTNQLCRDKNIAPSKTKELLLKHCSDIFLKSAKDNITLDDIATLNTKLIEIPVIEKKLKDRIISYEGGLRDLKKQREKLQTVDHGIDELNPLIKKLALSESQLEMTASGFANELDKQCIADEQNKKTDYTAQIQQFYFRYHEIKENSFSYTHHANAEQKYLIYEMDLLQVDSANSLKPDDEKKVIKHIEVKVKTYGGTQFGMSLGLCGSKFSESPKTYYLTGDSKILASEEDPIVPFIASLFSLNYDLGGYFSPAFSLGLGLPLSSGNGVENFAIFLGPGAYLGKKQSFLVSGGVMFSKVSKLKTPFKEGDTIIIGQGEIPTTKKYATGFFVSLTYNLSAL